jgi:hypothetical protein
MKLKAKFIGKPVDRDDLKAGDLTLIDDGQTLMLALVTQQAQGRGLVLLREWHAESGQTYPCRVDFDAVSMRHVRLIDEELSIEPITREPDAVFAMQEYNAPNGELWVLKDDFGVRVKQSMVNGTWSLISGKKFEPQSQDHPFHLVSAWRLVWRSGDDELTLCEFGKPAK